jgi:CheY-like chemotaxis protein
MRILLLHNNNVPFSFISENWGDDIDLEIEIIKPSTDDNDYDVFVSQQLGTIFSNNTFDLIILPYSFSEYNPIEYTGLIVAAHIRLTPEWNHSRKPILFVGPEETKQVAKLSEMGSILFSPGICSTRTNSLPNLIGGIKELSLEEITDSEFSEFLNRIQIPRPSNYATHHSIANEWAVMRWTNDVINWGEQEMPIIGTKSFTSMLYFKYLMAKAGSGEKISKSWKKKNGADPKINGISGKRVAYIDDEYDKGWGVLLSKIIENSGAKLHIYDKFKEYKDREDLISSINDFVDDIDADCYLLDLRLHDDDFDRTKGEISGHRIAAHIKDPKINRARQVVIFSASDKVWNMKEDVQKIGATDYVIKESPEANFTKNDSLRNFNEFKIAVKKACDLSYLKDYLNLLKATCYEDSFPLNNYMDLALLNSKNVLNSCILNLNLFIEDNADKGFELSDGIHIKKVGTNWEYNILNKIKVRKDNKDGKVLTIICLRDNSESIRYKKADGWENAKFDDTHRNERRMAKMVASLFYYYGINETDCKRYLDLRLERNTSVAHEGRLTSLRFEELKSFFDDIVTKIIKKENPKDTKG